jgi:hypothetical protein
VQINFANNFGYKRERETYLVWLVNDSSSRLEENIICMVSYFIIIHLLLQKIYSEGLLYMLLLLGILGDCLDLPS